MNLRRLLGVSLYFFFAALTTHASALDLDRQCSDSTVPFDLVSNFEVVVRGQVGGLDGLRLILDTGASHSVLDRRVAERMGLRLHSGQVFSFNRDLPISWADVPELRLGPMRVPGIRMMVGRLAEISEFARSADGIIGLDVLSRARKIEIDYERRRISFELDAGCESRPVVDKALFVTVAIQGVPVHLVVDTGLSYVLLYKDRLNTAIPHLRTEGQSRDARIGRLRATQVNLPGVPVFGRQGATPVFLIEGPVASKPSGLDGYLGPAALHPKRLELDFAGSALRWE